MLERIFQLKEAGTTVATEARAGITTFLTMAYILIVNPRILQNAIVIDGVDLFPELLTATALAAAIGTLLMGLLAKYPFALAPGMGINRVLHLHGRARAGRRLADRARRGVCVRARVHRAVGDGRAHADHQRDPAAPEAGNLGGHRAFPSRSSAPKAEGWSSITR